MSDDNQTAESAVPAVDAQALQRSVEALEKKNQELIAELRAAKAKAPKIPEGVNIDELVEFKRKSEQTELERQGKYQEARQALEQQYREATTEKDQRISELESKVRELELVIPAATALSEIVHDPDLVLKTKLKVDQIEREPDGTMVVVDGYQRVPVQEWAKNLPNWMQKQPKPQGSGAPTGSSNRDLPPSTANPFARETFNLTEQARLFRTDRDLYERLKTAANR